MRLSFTFLRGLAVVVFLLLGAAVAPAQGDIRIVYSPMVLELAGERGATVPFEITIMNQAQFSTAYFRSDVLGLAETREGVYTTRQSDEWEYNANSWIELQDEEFAIPPGGTHILRGRVQIPRRGSASGYATVVTELLPEPTPAGVQGSTSYYQQFSTALEITVGRQHRRSAYIAELRTIPTATAPELAMAYGRDGILFLASLKNDGDVHVRGQGQLIIRDPMGRRVRSVPLGSGRGVVIPEATLDFGSLIRGLAPGTYEIEARINYGGHRPAVARTTFEIGDDTAGISGLVAGRAMRVDATPSLIELNLQRQGYRASTITIANHDSEDVRFTVYVEDLAHDADGIPVRVDTEVEMPNSARSWVEIRPNDFILRPGQRRNVVIGFQVPEGQEGGRYARIQIQAEPANPTDDAEASSIVTDLDVAAYLTLGTEHTQRLEVVDLQWQQVPDAPHIMVGVSVGNAGNIHSRASGRLTLLKYSPPTEEVLEDGVILQRDERWDAIEQVPGDVTDTPLLPGELRFMQAAFTTPFEPLNQYQVVIEIPQPAGQPLAYRLDLWVDADGIIHHGLLPQESGDENATGS